MKSIKLPGVLNPNICGLPIPSNKSQMLTNFKLPDNSKFRHMMCLCADHYYIFHELFIKSYLAKDQKPLPFKPKEMVQIITNNEDEDVSGDPYDEAGENIESDLNSTNEIVLASSVKLRQGRKTTRRLVDEIEEHVKASKGKKRIKLSKEKKVPVKNVTAKKTFFCSNKKGRKKNETYVLIAGTRVCTSPHANIEFMLSL